jgi:NifU-like protein involved in Fe-S cluster formation
MASTAVLYTPEVLALATGLADYRWDDALPLKGDARSRSCGSTITLGLGLDAAGNIERVAVRSQACAIGQAAAAIFAEAAVGRAGGDIRVARDAISRWLAGDAPMPDWPGLTALATARDYPGRHGAILLAWQAASDLLP